MDVVSVHGIIIHLKANIPIGIHPLHMVWVVVSLHYLGWVILLYIYLVYNIVVVINPLSIEYHYAFVNEFLPSSLNGFIVCNEGYTKEHVSVEYKSSR